MRARTLPALIAASLALPAAAHAASVSGVVLSVDSAHRTMQVIDNRHAVHSFRFAPPAHLVRAGSRVRFTASGARVTHLVRIGTAATVTFAGRVESVRSRRLAIRLGDGRTIVFAGKQLGRRPAVLHGVQRAWSVLVVASVRGVAKLVLQRLARTGTSPGQSSGPGGSPGGGSGSGSGGGSAGSGGSGNGGGDVVSDVIGTITSVSDTAVTIATSSGRSMTFVVDDSSITDGFLVGDSVDVTYSQLDSGALDANDVEYNDQEVTGTATAVSPGGLTITVDGTGQSLTLVCDPADGYTDGINVGDSVTADYYVSAAGLAIDDLVDNAG